MTLNDTSDEADAFLKAAAAAGRFRGAVLLALKSEVLLRGGYGLANEEWRLPNTPTTKFRIGSVAKVFTAAAILRLVEAGAIDLSANIRRWLQDLPQPWQAFSIHQLLTHTAGLVDHVTAPAKRTLNRTGARPADLIDLIAREPLLFQPGTSRSYSNTGYILLGMLIEKVSSRSYAVYLDEEILCRLELTATEYDSHSHILPERASGYMLQNGQLQHADFLDMSVPFSAGGLVSTVDDLLRRNTALHGDGLISRGSYERMTARYPETQKEDGFYGYGLFIAKTSGYTCLSYSGGVNGFIAVLQYYPELHGSLIVLSNLPNPLAIQPVVQRLSGLLLDESRSRTSVGFLSLRLESTRCHRYLRNGSVLFGRKSRSNL
jgi:D-alanyl-D-alanine carboxypeptidase